jgi:26S proteasome regulatory subunit N1
LAEHARDAAQLFTVRLAQGLLHMGKGLVGLSPFHSDRQLMAAPGMAGVLIFLHCALDAQATILDKYHFLIYHLASAMHPRMLVAVDEDLNLLPTSVRVGKAVETVGQAGKPKTITGFQTHTTPVLLGVEDRAELADPDTREPLTLTLESVVIMKKVDPDAVDATP